MNAAAQSPQQGVVLLVFNFMGCFCSIDKRHKNACSVGSSIRDLVWGFLFLFSKQPLRVGKLSLCK